MTSYPGKPLVALYAVGRVGQKPLLHALDARHPVRHPDRDEQLNKWGTTHFGLAVTRHGDRKARDISSSDHYLTGHVRAGNLRLAGYL
jgi:hypothetical protein